MKCHANIYFRNNATSDDVPDSDLMDIDDITPNTNNAHKTIFFNRVRSNMIATVIKNNLISES
eukprot:965995-Ditylum_brightwellii.AAC.1